MSPCCSIKCVFLFFNTIFLASGVVLIVIGTMSYINYREITSFFGSSLSNTAILLMVVGSFIVLVSILGFLGALANNTSMMIAFICILIVVIGLEILAGAIFYAFRSRTAAIKGIQANIAFNKGARALINGYNQATSDTINNIQEKFKCCGADGSIDWSGSVGWGNKDAVPDSCCVVKSDGCGLNKNPKNIQNKGCISAIKLYLVKNLIWIGAVCILLAVGEVFGVLVGVCLCIDIKRKSYQQMH